MPNQLRVSLDKSTQPWSVHVDQQGNANHVDRSPDPQTIIWQLTGNAASGAIVSFAWVDTLPPDGIFGSPAISSNGNQMTLTDTHDSARSAGIWSYELTINVGGTDYSTLTELPAGRSATPVIRDT